MTLKEGKKYKGSFKKIRAKSECLCSLTSSWKGEARLGIVEFVFLYPYGQRGRLRFAKNFTLNEKEDLKIHPLAQREVEEKYI